MSFSQLLPRTRCGAERLGLGIRRKITNKRLLVRTVSNGAEATAKEDGPASYDHEEENDEDCK